MLWLIECSPLVPTTPSKMVGVFVSADHPRCWLCRSFGAWASIGNKALDICAGLGFIGTKDIGADREYIGLYK